MSKVPESIANRLGLVADEVVIVRLADGRLKERGLSEAKIEYAAAKRTISILIGAEGEEALLGLTALETLLLKVNPVTRKLEPYTPIEYLTVAA